MQTLTVSPATTIHGPTGAKISHGHSSTVIVTATSQDGDTHLFTVPVNGTVTWSPPEGWTQVTFTATGFQDEFRYVEWPADATAME